MRFPLLDDFRLADAAALNRLYEGLFERIEQREGTLRVFESGAPVKERVMRDIADLLKKYPDPAKRPPLFGVPVGVKALFRVDGEPTRVGSLLPADLFAGPEAALVTALRKAGAVIFGLTATAELASAEPAATCNPHNEAHTPGGSSSGSAAGVAAGFFPLAIGSQTIGSVVRPAAFCGVVGFKPSYGVLPTSGMVYFSPSADHAGIFTATVTEAAAAFRALRPESVAVPVPAAIRLGIPAGPYLEQAKPETVAHFRAALADFAAKSGGAVEIADVPCLEDVAAIATLHHDMINAEFAVEQGPFFFRYEGLYRPRTVANIRRGMLLGMEAAARGRESQTALRHKLGAVMNAHGLTAFAAPSAVGEADKGLLATGDPCMSTPWTHAGMPSVTVPIGVGPQGLPLGVQLVGRFADDGVLLALAEYLETL
ncbi:MAG: Glutamyl-tRNA(Gln) amidotransferase subunit A [Desulfovibrio sp.]